MLCACFIQSSWRATLGQGWVMACGASLGLQEGNERLSKREHYLKGQDLGLKRELKKRRSFVLRKN